MCGCGNNATNSGGGSDSLAVTGQAVTLAPVRFESAAAGSTQTQTISGHLDLGAPDFVYVPVEVPPGVAQLDVSYSYDKPAVPAGVNALPCTTTIKGDGGGPFGA